MTALLRIAGHFLRAQWAFTHLHGERLWQYQERRAQQIIAFATAHSPFYRAHWAGYNLRDWQNLPPIDKSRMMASFDTFNTQRVTKDEAMAVALRAERERDFAPTLRGLTIGLSSGTSGHRGLFLLSSAETAAWAGTILARTLHRLPPFGYRIAFFLRSNSNLYERVGAGKRLQFRWFDLMTPLPEAVTRLNEYAPHLLIGPPSLLRLFAAEHTANRLLIRPERLISVAETLEPQDKAYLENVFGIPTHQVYQCTEGFLAATCTAGNLHIQEDLVALQYEPVVPVFDTAFEGETKRVTPIVTDLWRRVQPIVRYRLGDVLHLGSGPCSCGSAFQVLEAIEGRCDDLCFFVTRDGGLRVFFPDTIRRMILLAHPGIADYAAEQRGPGQLRIFVALSENVSTDAVCAALRKSVATTIAQYDCRPAQVHVEIGVPAPLPGVKRRRIRSHMAECAP